MKENEKFISPKTANAMVSAITRKYGESEREALDRFPFDYFDDEKGSRFLVFHGKYFNGEEMLDKDVIIPEEDVREMAKYETMSLIEKIKEMDMLIDNILDFRSNLRDLEPEDLEKFEIAQIKRDVMFRMTNAKEAEILSFMDGNSRTNLGQLKDIAQKEGLNNLANQLEMIINIQVPDYLKNNAYEINEEVEVYVNGIYNIQKGYTINENGDFSIDYCHVNRGNVNSEYTISFNRDLFDLGARFLNDSLQVHYEHYYGRDDKDWSYDFYVDREKLEKGEISFTREELHDDPPINFEETSKDVDSFFNREEDSLSEFKMPEQEASDIEIEQELEEEMEVEQE